ncbi:MAG: pyridoxal-phosphate dependent enzyme [Planctomycetia bacterium]|nr:pyridoxal-phosphate dependent enzyme [Planctomycetia bacterium]
MSIWRFAEFLPETPAEARITLGEGGTPLVRSRRIGPSLGLDHLYFKLETTNPSGSYKDRFAAAAVASMLARGQKLCLATSSGNTGAALAAYCAAAGLPCFVAVVDGAARNKLRQMMAYGARIYSVRRFGLDAGVTTAVFERLARLAAARSAALHISAYRYSPLGMAGVETIAYELAAELKDGPDHVFCQAGGGGMVLAAARGFEQLRRLGLAGRPVAVECVQPEGNNTIAGPLRDGDSQAHPTTSTTKVSGLQVASVIDGDDVIRACRACGGTGHLVSDAAVFDAQARLAREEGIFSEPAGATSVAGAIAARKAGYLRSDATVVCCVTGIGFKDEASVERMIEAAECPTLDAPDDIDCLVPPL